MEESGRQRSDPDAGVLRPKAGDRHAPALAGTVPLHLIPDRRMLNQALPLHPDNAPHPVRELLCHAESSIEFSHIGPLNGCLPYRESARNQAGKSLNTRRNCDVSPSMLVEILPKIKILRKRRSVPHGIKEYVVSILAKESYRHRFIS